MRWAEGFIAVDWGTTNRRAYRIGGDGQCGEEFEDSRGVLSVEPDGFPEAVAEIRAWKCDRVKAEEAFIGFFVGDGCIAVSEACIGFVDLEAAMTAAFPGTVRWRSAVMLPVCERNETVLYRRC